MGFLVQGHTVHIPMPVYQITYKLMDGSSDWVHSGRKGKGVSWNMYQFWSLPLADWKGSHAIKLLTSNWLVRGGHSFGVLELESVLPVWIYSNGNALSLFSMMRILVLFVYYIYYFFWLHWVFLCCLFFFCLLYCLSLVVGSKLLIGAFSCFRVQDLGAWVSAVASRGLGSCGMACGIFLDQGSNPCPLH